MFICGTGYMPARHSFESLFNVNMLFVHVFTLKDGSKIGCCNQKHATDPVHKHQVENNPEYFLKKKKKNHRSAAKVTFESGKLSPFANATKRTLAAE